MGEPTLWVLRCPFGNEECDDLDHYGTASVEEVIEWLQAKGAIRWPGDYESLSLRAPVWKLRRAVEIALGYPEVSDE